MIYEPASLNSWVDTTGFESTRTLGTVLNENLEISAIHPKLCIPIPIFILLDRVALEFKKNMSCYYQISNRPLEIPQMNGKNISRHYHTSFQGNLVNFYPRPKMIYDKCCKSKLFRGPKFLTPPPKFVSPHYKYFNLDDLCESLLLKKFLFISLISSPLIFHPLPLLNIVI